MPSDCMTGCGRTVRTRGLCQRCYHLAWQRVRAGKTTWAAEEKAGRCSAGDPESRVPYYRKVKRLMEADK